MSHVKSRRIKKDQNQQCSGRRKPEKCKKITTKTQQVRKGKKNLQVREGKKRPKSAMFWKEKTQKTTTKTNTSSVL